MASSATTTAEPSRDAPAPQDGAGAQLLTFRVGTQRYACRLDAVREIFVARPTTRLPGAAPHVMGLLNVRGALLTVLDVGRWLSAAGVGTVGDGGASDSASVVAGDPAATMSEGHVLVVGTDGRSAGCRVDGLGRALPMPPLDPPAPGGNGTVGGIILGIGEADGELVAVLDLPLLVSQSLLFPGER